MLHKAAHRSQNNHPYIVVRVIISLLSGVLIAAIGLLLFARVIQRSGLSLQVCILPATLLMALGAFCAGFSLTKTTRFNGILSGLGGGLFFCLIFIAAAALDGPEPLTWYTPLKASCMILSSTTGGWIASMQPVRRHKR